jgi:hypothetical protein
MQNSYIFHSSKVEPIQLQICKISAILLEDNEFWSQNIGNRIHRGLQAYQICAGGAFFATESKAEFLRKEFVLPF